MLTEPVRNDSIIGSSWSQNHRTSGMQSSSPYKGIENSSKALVKIRNFKDDTGRKLRSSPWLILSSKKYVDFPMLVLFGGQL